MFTQFTVRLIEVPGLPLTGQGVLLIPAPTITNPLLGFPARVAIVQTTVPPSPVKLTGSEEFGEKLTIRLFGLLDQPQLTEETSVQLDDFWRMAVKVTEPPSLAIEGELRVAEVGVLHFTQGATAFLPDWAANTRIWLV